MSKRFTEDEIPTHRGRRQDTHPDTMLGRLMRESVDHNTRIEALESVVFREAKPSTWPTVGKYLPLIKKTVTAAVLVIAGVLSALKELGFFDK